MISKQALKALLKGYSGDIHTSDEIWSGEAQVQKHWESLLQKIHRLGPEEMNQRKTEMQRLLADNGVTYNVYDTKAVSRVWELDPIPFIIPSDTWSLLKKGIQQRALVLDLIYKDLYGPRRLFSDGIIPPELIFIDRHFLRACDQTPNSKAPSILLYGVDISRSTDGQIWVVGDRTQAPSGWAYAMENRVSMARVLPEIFSSTRVKKIAPFYQQLRENLSFAAKGNNQDPLVVLLSPGPYNATYFEHAFIAALQGYQLVQGQDLMVKDNYVWLKTLSGLEKVDVIVRHVDDDYCDPLSLRPDSQLGVAGLLEVMRQGNVTLANPLGSGILENPGLMAFMPTICKYFLGEELILPNIASWWCGQQSEMNYVLENLEQLVIKDIYKKRGSRSIFGWALTSNERTELEQKIKAFPHRFVGQEQAIFSTAPSWGDNHLEPRQTVLRCLASAGKDNNYFVMPGGLTRSAPKAGNSHISNRSGGIGKDTWVLSDKKEDPVQYNPEQNQRPFRHQYLANLSSRTGEQLFWVGRYFTRVRMTARFLRAILKHQMDISNFEEGSDQELEKILLKALTHVTMTYPGFVGDNEDNLLENPVSEMISLLKDEERVGSLAYSVKMLKNAANNVRNRWAQDTWTVIDKLELHWRNWCEKEKYTIRSGRKALDQLITHLSAIQGFTINSLSLEEGRPLFELGMNLERAQLSISLLRASVTNSYPLLLEGQLLELLLITFESLNSYRHRYRGHLNLAGTLELCLLDNSYPQSLAACIKNIQDCLAQLPKNSADNGFRADQKEILKIATRVQLAELDALIKQAEGEFTRNNLEQFFQESYQDLTEAAKAVMETFFRHTFYEAQTSIFKFELDV